MQVAQPLHKLNLDENAGKKKAVIRWSDRCQWAFNDLKKLFITVPILIYMDFTCPLSSILMLVDLAWALFSIRPMRMVWMQ